MKTCAAQSREPAPEILETIHRLFTERPPTPDEEGLLQQIRALEGRFGLGIHSGGGLPDLEAFSVPAPRDEVHYLEYQMGYFNDPLFQEGIQ